MSNPTGERATSGSPVHDERDKRETGRSPVHDERADLTGDGSISRSSVHTRHDELQGIRTDTNPLEASTPPADKVRRAAKRQLQREYNTLLDKIAKFQPPPRESSRSNKGKRRHHVNGTKYDNFAEEFGSTATRESVIDELTNWVDHNVFDPVFKHLLT